MDIRRFAHIHFAAIGDGTRRALEEHGIYCDFVPTAFSSEDMARSLVPLLKPKDKVLLLRAREANKVLPEAIRAAGVDCTCISLYHTVYDKRKAEELNRMLPGIDYVTFASSSAVKAYASMVEDLSAMKGKYISIGPVTTKTAERLGLKVAGTAAVYTARGMVETMIQDAANDSNGK